MKRHLHRRWSPAAAVVLLAAGSGIWPHPREASDAGAARRVYHLVLTSNRDGDVDVYGASADGTRVAALTRNNDQDENVVASPDGRWVAVAGRGASASGTFLISGDGRQRRLVARDRATDTEAIFHEPAAFSRDGRWLAVTSEDIFGEVTKTVLVATSTGRARVLGWGAARSFSPDGRYILMGNRVRELRTGRTWWTGAADGFLWSPRGRQLALIKYGSQQGLLVLDMTRRASRPRRVLRGLVTARWIGDARLGYEREENGSSHIGIATTGGSVRTLHTAPDYLSVEWSPRGTHVAYTVVVHPDRYDDDCCETRLLSADGRTSRVLPGIPAWSPSGRRYAIEARSGGQQVLLIVDPASNRVTRRLRWPAGARQLVWSPDERHIAFRASRGDIGVADLASARTRWVLRGGSSAIAAWVAGPLPASALTAPPLPPVETASPSGFRAEGAIVEIDASESRVAALVDGSRRDCDHAVAWTIGRRSVVRFSAPAPCEGDGPVPYGEHLFGLRLAGTALSWKGFHCGNFCYHTDYSADVRRPGRQQAGEEMGVDDESRPGHPRPRPETHRGVTMSVVRGTVRLRRQADGRAATIRPSGALTDADLEPAGLFYAYNLRRGARPGRVVFVRFDRLLR